MSKTHGQKRLITFFTISLILLFVLGSAELRGDVGAKKCWEAYEDCMWHYGGYLPSPHNLHAISYCGIGVAFCLLYM